MYYQQRPLSRPFGTCSCSMVHLLIGLLTLWTFILGLDVRLSIDFRDFQDMCGIGPEITEMIGETGLFLAREGQNCIVSLFRR